MKKDIQNMDNPLWEDTDLCSVSVVLICVMRGGQKENRDRGSVLHMRRDAHKENNLRRTITTNP